MKQEKRKIGYEFKKKIPGFIRAVAENRMEGIQFDLQEDGRRSVLVVQIGKVQFSFHGIRINDIAEILNQNENLKTKTEWDGVRKQMCAVTAFRIAEANTYHLQTTDGEDMTDCYERIREQVATGSISLNEILSGENAPPSKSTEEKKSKKTKSTASKKLNSNFASTIGDILKAQGIDLLELIKYK